MKHLLYAGLLLLPSCGTPFFEVQVDVLCQEYCWNIHFCEQEGDREHVVSHPVHMDSCLHSCDIAATEEHEARMRSAYNTGMVDCEYVDYYAARFGDTFDCDEGQSSTVTDYVISDCYATPN